MSEERKFDGDSFASGIIVGFLFMFFIAMLIDTARESNIWQAQCAYQAVANGSTQWKSDDSTCTYIADDKLFIIDSDKIEVPSTMNVHGDG